MALPTANANSIAIAGGAVAVAMIDVLVQNQPAEEHGDHRIHVGIGRDFRRGRMLEQPDVSRITDP